MTAAVVNTEMVFGVPGVSPQHAALGGRCFVKAARGFLLELDVCDGHAGELAI